MPAAAGLAAVSERDLRVDGWLRADARPAHPGVTVVLPDSDEGRISFSTDRYRGGRRWRPSMEGGPLHMPGWQANVRAIALSMEALRATDRHGIMQGRQYAGFRELGSGTPMGPGESAMTVEDAARFTADHSPATPDAVLEGGKAREMAYRFAAKRLHPDAGGDPGLFAQLQEAKRLLDDHGRCKEAEAS